MALLYLAVTMMVAIILEGLLLGLPSHPDLLFNFSTKLLSERIQEASLAFSTSR